MGIEPIPDSSYAFENTGDRHNDRPKPSMSERFICEILENTVLKAIADVTGQSHVRSAGACCDLQFIENLDERRMRR